jgi:hypothetical protein
MAWGRAEARRLWPVEVLPYAGKGREGAAGYGGSKKLRPTNGERTPPNGLKKSNLEVLRGPFPPAASRRVIFSLFLEESLTNFPYLLQ